MKKESKQEIKHEGVILLDIYDLVTKEEYDTIDVQDSSVKEEIYAHESGEES
ncbi:hypothetical protein [Erysipelothrix aquatica]|uniref:hypothetical protein n=1 Tax=Erysipelothrix aquatica TaxID=2683714 RepID=UPI00135964DC|nr:hypothetical protein [Erysipelothrix aquatica]